jgi:hypothetical protein
LTNPDIELLEGKTLNVYAYLVKEDKPVGPREVMRGANLSSPSVAHWHLQKLESAGLLEKNAYGEYTVKQKVNVSGHLWIGKTLVPRLICYALFFLAVVATEVAIILTQYFFQSKAPGIDLTYLVITNAVATAIFLAEGLQLRRKTHQEAAKHTKNDV